MEKVLCVSSNITSYIQLRLIIYIIKIKDVILNAHDCDYHLGERSR